MSLQELSPQRKYQLRMVAEGRCEKCGRRKPKGEDRQTCWTCRRKRIARRLAKMASANGKAKRTK